MTSFRNKLPAIPGMTLGSWLRLLHRNRHDVSMRYKGRLALVTAMSAMNSILRPMDILIYGRRIKKARIEKPPLFIIGHWRSGTSHLHNLLCQDENLNCPNTYQTMLPHHFLSSEIIGRRIFNFIAPPKRPMDNMTFGAVFPQEDEFATAALSTASPYMRFLFPVTGDCEYSALDPLQLSEEILAQWKASLVHFLKKLHCLNSKRLVLKSPPHLGRLAVLIEMFPGAQFIHIVRNPYEVYLSTKKLWKTTIAYSFLQDTKKGFTDDLILSMYSEFFFLFERDRKRIPKESLHEMKFEDLEKDPKQSLLMLYRNLDLPDFERFWKKTKNYLESISDYRKNVYHLDKKSKRIVQRHWGKTFDRYGYPK